METKPVMTLGKAASAWLRRREVGGVAAPADLSKVRIIPHTPKTLAERRKRLSQIKPTKPSPAYLLEFRGRHSKP